MIKLRNKVKVPTIINLKVIRQKEHMLVQTLSTIEQLQLKQANNNQQLSEIVMTSRQGFKLTENLYQYNNNLEVRKKLTFQMLNELHRKAPYLKEDSRYNNNNSQFNKSLAIMKICQLEEAVVEGVEHVCNRRKEITKPL